MILKANELSWDQKVAIEGLLGHSIQDDDAVSVRALTISSAPQWLQRSWESARREGVDRLTAEDIEAIPISSFPRCLTHLVRLGTFYLRFSVGRSFSFASA